MKYRLGKLRPRKLEFVDAYDPELLDLCTGDWPSTPRGNLPLPSLETARARDE